VFLALSLNGGEQALPVFSSEEEAKMFSHCAWRSLSLLQAVGAHSQIEVLAKARQMGLLTS
jgi:hypothetical protein